MTTTKQMSLALDYRTALDVLNDRISEVRDMMTGLEQSVSKLPAVKKKQLSLGARVVGNATVGDMSVFVHLVERGASLDITVYNHKDRSLEITDMSHTNLGDCERTELKVAGQTLLIVLYAKTRTGQASFQYKGLTIGLADLKEVPLNPFEE